MKKFLRLALITCILVLTVGQTTNAQFSDLSEDNPHYQTVMNLVAEGVVDGYEDGTIGLEKNITRAELAKIIVAGKGIHPDYLIYNRCFNDVEILEWYVSYVCYAESEGWILGYPDGTFRPEANINNAEVLSMILRSYDYITPMITDFENWYDPYLALAEYNEFVLEGEFEQPYDAALRSFAFEVLNRVIGYAPNELTETYSYENISIKHPERFFIETDETMPDAIAVINDDDDGVGFFPTDFFDQFLEDMGMTEEEFNLATLFGEMPGQRIEIDIAKGKVVDFLNENEFSEGGEGLIIIQVAPESGTGDDYYIFGYYTRPEMRPVIIEMIESIEVR